MIRITADRSFGANTVLLPALRKVPAGLSGHQGRDHGSTTPLTDIVRGIATMPGVRFGGGHTKGMIAVPIGPDLCMAAVASAVLLRRWPIPADPAGSHEPTTCINMRLPPPRFPVCLGVREGRARIPGAGGWPARPQRCRTDARGGARRFWSRRCCRKTRCARTSRLVGWSGFSTNGLRFLFGLPSLLSEPSPKLSCF